MERTDRAARRTPGQARVFPDPRQEKQLTWPEPAQALHELALESHLARPPQPLQDTRPLPPQGEQLVSTGCEVPIANPPPPDGGPATEPDVRIVSQSIDLSRNASRSAQSQPITVHPVKKTIRKRIHTGELASRSRNRRQAPIKTGAK